MIVIKTTMLGDKIEADAEFDGEAYFSVERTTALALSEICKRISKNKKAIGQKWISPRDNMGGVIGDVKKRNARRKLSDLPTFELIGGKMAGDE